MTNPWLFSLDPCCNGIPLNDVNDGMTVVTLFCLDPCCNGIPLNDVIGIVIGFFAAMS